MLRRIQEEAVTKSKNQRKPWTGDEFRAIQVMAHRLVSSNEVISVYRAVRELQASMPDRSWDAIRSKLFEARTNLSARVNYDARDGQIG
jgi:hypothetical protein